MKLVREESCLVMVNIQFARGWNSRARASLVNRSDHSLLSNGTFRSLFDWLLWHFGVILIQLQQSSTLVFIQHLPCFSAMPLESISRKYSRLLYPSRTQSVQCSRLQEFTRKKKQHKTSQSLSGAKQTQLKAALFHQSSLHRYRSPACGCYRLGKRYLMMSHSHWSLQHLITACCAFSCL